MSYGIPTLRPGQTVSDVIGDPYTRSLYFGTSTTPGFINQLQQVARKRFAEPLPELKIADLTDLEQTGLDRLKSGIGGYERFLTSGEDQLSAIRNLQDPLMEQLCISAGYRSKLRTALKYRSETTDKSLQSYIAEHPVTTQYLMAKMPHEGYTTR